MNRKAVCNTLLVLCMAAGSAHAQLMQEGQWLGRIIHLTGRYMDTVNEVRYEDGALAITMRVNNYGPFEFEQIRLTPDSLSFAWQPSFELKCTLKLLPDGVYQGACMDPWGGFGGIVLGPPGTDVDAVALHEETIERIAGWTPPPVEEPLLVPEYPQGKTAIVGEKEFNFVAAGSGPVTIILEAGLGDHLGVWEDLHQRLARSTRVIAYDRAGMGLSEVADTPRTPEQMATELRGVLREAGAAGPYVLVAHAESAFMARRFASLYGSDIKALILIEPHHENQAAMWRALSEVSWNRYWNQKKAFYSQLSGGTADEHAAYAAIIDGGSFPGLEAVPTVPTYVLSAGRSRSDASWVGESVLGRRHWANLHATWVRAMPEGHHLVFPASGPYIHHEDLDGVARLIEGLLE